MLGYFSLPKLGNILNPNINNFWYLRILVSATMIYKKEGRPWRHITPGYVTKIFNLIWFEKSKKVGNSLDCLQNYLKRWNGMDALFEMNFPRSYEMDDLSIVLMWCLLWFWNNRSGQRIIQSLSLRPNWLDMRGEHIKESADRKERQKCCWLWWGNIWYLMKSYFLAIWREVSMFFALLTEHRFHLIGNILSRLLRARNGLKVLS